MAKTPFESVDQYIASLPDAVQGVLQRVRSAIRKAVPEGEETISYNIPTYKLHDRPVLSVAGWRRHFSLYGSTARLIAAFQEELTPNEIDKGTIRFPFSEPVPVKLIEGIAKFRATEAAELGKAKSAASKKR